MKKREFVTGDIHGHYNEMLELLEMVKFNFNSLICLGDLVDRGSKPIQVIETLMRMKHLTCILGNHDEWCYQYLVNNSQPIDWLLQGGQTTLNAYIDNPVYIQRHISFFEKAMLYSIDEENRLFVHGGFNHHIPFNLQRDNKELVTWDRSLVNAAMEYEKYDCVFTEFNEIFVGHTPTQFIKYDYPLKISNLWMLDTGVSFSRKIAIMNIETKDFWQSTSESNKLKKNEE
ncbi:MAG: metallophosphoesterase [Bacteroidales bacterium]